ncbi:natural resistance-associated macrophage protein [Rickenella mellea]|uniref:Natural resistance-associated macrophage protein n=1 Tax=Rickenella mellea TaxID=50990 RepID=A0A4Y7QPH0_9AGAM|nr:natural resistance-associated macrophage protein [Rickenella mellea]
MAPQSQRSSLRKAIDALSHHARRHVGVGVMCAVAYFDPGNWSVDLQAGSQFGYKLLFMVLVAGLGAVVLQVLACKLGCVTGLDLASHCRLLLNNHPKYPRLVRRLFLYPLYGLAELSIISTDLAELLGSAIGLCLIFPKLPLWVAVLLTASDVFIILLVGDPSRGHGRPVRTFEIIIVVLVLIVFICFVILIVKVKPHWPAVFDGLIPSKTVILPNGLYAAIGILGATVMPHALFLGSFLATQDRVSSGPPVLGSPATANIASRRTWQTALRSILYMEKSERDFIEKDHRTPHGERENNTLSFIRAHLSHGIVDIVGSLLGFAVAINSAILVLAAAVFFYGPGRPIDGPSRPAGLFDAHDLIRDLIGKPAAFVFALALICSGQTASITATLAGQVVSEGFIEWRMSPFLRRIVTRLIGLIPSLAIAVAVGRPGIDTLLVISQVVLSVVLPFVAFPLVWLTSSRLVMGVRKPRELVTAPADDNSSADKPPENAETNADVHEIAKVDSQQVEEKIRSPGMVCDDETVDYSNGRFLTMLSYLLWLVILVANGYLVVTLAI